jgi:uncharacterized Zn finger protein
MDDKPAPLTALDALTEDDVRARCTEQSFSRGQSYYAGGAVSRTIRRDHGLEALVAGTQTYRVRVWVVNEALQTSCTCPYDWGGDCKHIVVTLLAWLDDPDRFQPPIDLKAVLKRRSKADLVNLLSDILTVYPNLVDELDILGNRNERELPDKVAEIMATLAPWGSNSEAEVEAHLHLIARRADRLAEAGKAMLARKAYYALLSHTIGLCKSYGHYDYFSDDIPYVFAVAYEALAFDQIETHGEEIRAELEEIFSGDYQPEILWATDEHLSNVAYELGMYEEG